MSVNEKFNTTAKKVLIIIGSFLFNVCFGQDGQNSIQNTTSAGTDTGLIFTVVFLIAVLLILFFKNFTNLRLENFQSFTDQNELIVKIRSLSILSFTLFPLTEYFESEYLHLYPSNWPPVFAIMAVALICLIISFRKNNSMALLSSLPQISYYVVYSMLIYKAVNGGLLPIMAIETAAIILFSKLIFSKLKNSLYFLGFVGVSNLVLINLIAINEANLNIHLSATLQASIVSVALFLIEGSTIRKVAFGSKMLESSNLLVFVSDLNGDIVYVNESFEKTMGISQNQILKDGWWKRLGLESSTTLEFKKLIAQSNDLNAKNIFENSLVNERGELVYISWNNSMLQNEFFVAVGKNITHTRLLEIEEGKRKTKKDEYTKLLTELTLHPTGDQNNLQELLQSITKKASHALGIERVSIWEYNEDSIKCLKVYSQSKNEFENGALLLENEFPVYFKAIKEARVIDAPDVDSHPDTMEFNVTYSEPEDIRSLLDVPIFINGKLSGVVCCEQSTVLKKWDEEDIRFVTGISNLTAITLEAAKRKELEAEYRHILNNAGDIIYTADAYGYFEFINSTVARLLGYSISELVGKHFTSIVHKAHKKETESFYLKQFQQRIESTYFEFKVVTAKGQEIWVGQNVRLVADKANENLVGGFQAVVRDITKQKETEFALIASENNFRQINENINEVFYLYNFETSRYDYVSPNSSVILGAEPSFFYEGKDYTKHFLIEEDKETVSELNRTGANRDKYEIEFRIIVDGEVKYIKERSYPIYNQEGKIIKKSGMCADVTHEHSQSERIRQLSLVAQTVSNGVVITNADGTIEWCNDSMSRLTEYSLEELIGKNPLQLLSGPETNAELKSKIAKNQLRGDNVELQQYTKSGAVKWFMVTSTPLLNDDGSVDKFIEVVTDITDRKELEQQYAYIINNAGDVIYTTNELGYVDFLNESIITILGYTPDDLIGKHFTHIIHPEFKKRIGLFYLKQFAQLQEATYCEFKVINKEGDAIWVGQNVKLILSEGEKKTVKGFQAILRDITKQKAAELALIDSENNLRQISETINDLFYLYNFSQNKYEYISPNASQILGVKAEYFYEGNDFASDYVIEKDQEMVRSAYEGVKQGASFEIEYRIRVGQEIRWIKEKSFAIKDENGTIIKTSGTCIDVTYKKMQEKRLLRVNKELSSYSEDLEINNLLKEQLIYSNSFEEIAQVSINTLRRKISNIARGSLFLVNDSNTGFDVYYLEDERVKRTSEEFSELRSIETLRSGRRYLSKNLDTAVDISRYDQQYRSDGIKSYIMLPINYSSNLIGALGIGFEQSLGLSKRELDMLENFTSVLSVVVNKLKLQKELSEKSSDIMSSLAYARSIQQSILPNISHHEAAIKNFMALYMPKDVVSGDFYLIESLEDCTIIALGDCTGHGVPGAFLTLLGSNFLQRIAIENKVTSPQKILEYLDYQIFTMLNKNREEMIRDGMELGLCVYNHKTKKLTFAGAGLFLLFYRGNEQFIVKGSKRSIGDENHGNMQFVEEVIELDGTEKFYMFSDGYRDQLGGMEKRKRFSRAAFFQLLNKIKNLPSHQQEYLLKLEHDKHKGTSEQTDDISIIGFELK